MNCNAKWIWTRLQEDRIHQYAEFRRTFAVSRLQKKYVVSISADSDYELWINGVFTGWNQYPDWPDQKKYNEHDISGLLRKGKNCVAVRVFYRGRDFFTYAKGMAGLIFSLNSNSGPVLCSDKKWRCREGICYKNGNRVAVNKQLGFTVEYDARCEDDWKTRDYKDSRWSRAIELQQSPDLKKRPVSQLLLHEPKPARLISAGTLIRKRQYSTPAETMMNDSLSSAGLDLTVAGERVEPGAVFLPAANGKSVTAKLKSGGVGMYFVFDLGCEEAGLLSLDIETPGGTILDISHGEHLDDLRVRSFVGGYNFADKYVCRSGRQQWLFPYRRLGCRYLQIHVPRIRGSLNIYHVTLRPTTYPFKHKGSFRCADNDLNKIWSLSKRTLELCAHEHFEDCPWREQALYGLDSRLESLYSFYAFGDTQYASACLDLLGGGMCPDGLLAMTAPARPDVNIPGFSLHWICGVWETVLYSGDRKFAKKQYGRVCEILDRTLERMTSPGVVPNSTELHHWHFHEWTDGLNGYAKKGQKEFDALYNLDFAEALRAAVLLGRYIEEPRGREYARIRKRVLRGFHAVFWNDKLHTYASFSDGRRQYHYAQLTQALAIQAGAVPSAGLRNQLCRKLVEDDALVKTSYPGKLFLYDALLSTGGTYMKYVLEDIRNVFGKMAESGATSLHEAEGGSEAFQHAGSLCHGWSSIFNYIAGAYILGIRPLEPGFKTFSVKPLLHATDLGWAKGVVPAGTGSIVVSIQGNRGKAALNATYPRSLQARIAVPRNWQIKMKKL